LKKFTKVGALAISAALLFAGCGEAPTAEIQTPVTLPAEVTPGETAPEEVVEVVEPAENVLPCIVADQGGFDDRSFNQSAFEGVQEAATQLGISTFPNIQSVDPASFVPNLEALVDQGCTLIVATGFAFAEAVVATAHAHPDVHFLMVDSDAVVDGQLPPENVKTVLFDTAQAAFLAGYVSAAFSAREGGANHVGTFGGMAFPTVTIFMDGFRQGVLYYNEQNGANVQVTGWDGTDGSFTGGFFAGPEATAISQGLVDQGVDVILPVGGPIYQSAVTVIEGAGREIALIGVDQDLFFTDPTTEDIVLTSILKEINVAVRDSILMSAEGAWDPTPYVGTLTNGGVGLAPFHNFEDQISQDVRDKVAQLQSDIIAGSVTVNSPFNE